MINDDRIETLHPQGKKGVNILRSKYDVIANYMIEKVKENGVITYQDLSDMAVEDLSDSFDGKVMWYVVTVKLDLEARGIFERVPKTSPHKIRLKNTP